MNIVVKDCSCPMCGAPEVVDDTLPILEQRLNVRGFKVEHSGLWWSECLLCKEKYGNGWFATEDDGTVVIESAVTAAMLIAEGVEVELIEGPRS